ncbi:hypothetical protein [Hahella chejuensis]|uniref:hypothetical protein n=1 Tax=Hahella chejuensis TaxID=158327 RepID=UPI0011D04605|nr:hypothetical protein [Hahella chejuensis]
MSEIYADKVNEYLNRALELAANPDEWDYYGLEAYVTCEALGELVDHTANYLKELGTKPENYAQAAQD